jgi:hypothetical protein
MGESQKKIGGSPRIREVAEVWAKLAPSFGVREQLQKSGERLE